MDHYAEHAAKFADSARLAIACLRAIVDGRIDDAVSVMKDANPYWVAYQLAHVSSKSGITDEFLDLELDLINRADVDGQLERFARENLVLDDKEPVHTEALENFHPQGKTTTGITIGTVYQCETCAEYGTCCQGQGFCVVIRHPCEPEIIQHMTAMEAWETVTFLLAAARKAR